MRASFRLKAGIILWVFWVLVVGAVGYLGHIRAGDSLARDRARFDRLVGTIAVAYSETVFHHPAGEFPTLKEEIEHHLKKLVEADSEIVYAAVIDRDGKQICRVEGQGESVEDEDRSKSVPLIHFGEPIGTLHVRLSANQSLREATARRNYTLSLVGMAAVAGLGILLVIDARLRRILGRLIQSTGRMASGDLSQRITIDTHDELEELGHSFNRMAENLAESQAALHQTNEKLAVSVAERTRQLSKSEIRYKNLVDSSGDAIMTTDMHGLVTFGNRSAQEIFGFTEAVAETMIGMPIYRLYAAGKPEAVAIMAELRAGRPVHNREIAIVGHDGRNCVISMSATLLSDEWGEPLGTLGVAKDVTELKALEKRVIHSERLATIGKMSAKIAHELRNPLSSLSLNAEMLDEELPDGEQAEGSEAKPLLRAMAREIERLTAITEEYLEFSRVPTPSPQPVDLGEQLDTLVAFMTKEFDEQGVTVCLDLPDEPVVGQVDRRQIRQCLINLLRNANEAMEEGGRLTICLRATDSQVSVQIDDSGPGISEQHSERVFEPFFTTKSSGTGLGLAICSEIVTGHGGKIRIGRSELGGASIRLTLPKSEQANGTGSGSGLVGEDSL